jgi:hypothetical protein
MINWTEEAIEAAFRAHMDHYLESNVRPGPMVEPDPLAAIKDALDAAVLAQGLAVHEEVKPKTKSKIILSEGF